MSMQINPNNSSSNTQKGLSKTNAMHTKNMDKLSSKTILSNSKDNLQGAAISSANLDPVHSKITDPDFAKEKMASIRDQMLKQAGTAVLSHSSHSPQRVLVLLQD